MKAILFAVISSAISTPLQVLNSIFILHDEAPPDISFLIPVAIIGLLMKTLYAYNAMKVSDAHMAIFSIAFYGFLIVTGALLPVIYRFSEFNKKNTVLPFRFGTIFALCLWSPVVLIMVAFGMDLLPVIYILVFYICITGMAVINACLLHGKKFGIKFIEASNNKDDREQCI